MGGIAQQFPAFRRCGRRRAVVAAAVALAALLAWPGPAAVADGQDDFVTEFAALAALADGYAATADYEAAAYDAAYADWLPFMYLRQCESGYTTAAWSYVGGAVDQGFVAYVRAQDPALAAYCAGLTAVGGADVRHLAAAVTAQLFLSSSVRLTADQLTALGASEAQIAAFRAFGRLPLPATDLMTEAQYDDLAGWAGDLQTFTAYLVGHHNAEADAGYYEQVAAAYLGQAGTTFDLADLYADADAADLAARIVGGATAAEAVAAVCGGGLTAAERFAALVGDRTTAQIAAAAGEYTQAEYAPPAGMGLLTTAWPLLRGTAVTAAQAEGIAAGYADVLAFYVPEYRVSFVTGAGFTAEAERSVIRAGGTLAFSIAAVDGWSLTGVTAEGATVTGSGGAYVLSDPTGSTTVTVTGEPPAAGHGHMTAADVEVIILVAVLLSVFSIGAWVISLRRP